MVTATAFLKAFNDGRMLHVGKRVVVVGGGFSGVETAAEINDLLKSSRRFFPSLAGEAMRVILSRIDYPDKDVDVVGVPDPLLVGRPELVFDEGERPVRPHLSV